MHMMIIMSTSWLRGTVARRPSFGPTAVWRVPAHSGGRDGISAGMRLSQSPPPHFPSPQVDIFERQRIVFSQQFIHEDWSQPHCT